MKPVLPALMNMDTTSLQRELLSKPSQWVSWPGSEHVSIPTNDALRLRILAGKVLPELEGRLDVRVPRQNSGEGLKLRVIESAEGPRRFDRNARMSDKTKALLTEATPQELPVRVRSVYEAGWSLAHIAEALDVSRQWVSVLITRAQDTYAPVLGPEHQRPCVASRPHGLNSYWKVRQELDEATAIIGHQRLSALLEIRSTLPVHGQPIGGRDSTQRARTVKFWEELIHLVDHEGVSVRILSVLMDVTPSAIYVMRSRVPSDPDADAQIAQTEPLEVFDPALRTAIPEPRWYGNGSLLGKMRSTGAALRKKMRR